MATQDIKTRRKALDLTRAELAQAAYVDKRILQLIELKQHHGEEAESRLHRALDALEGGQELPDFKAEMDAKR